MINDYPELIVETARLAGVSDLVQRAPMVIGLAERYLNKNLRMGDMETDVTLTTDANGEATLPSDFQEFRSVRFGERAISKVNLEDLLRNRFRGYAIKGSTFKSSETSTAHECVYYAGLPGLVANSTNWLLTDEPEIYLHAALFQTYVLNKDNDQAAAERVYLDNLIMEANDADFRKRKTGTRLTLPGTVV